MMGVLCSYLIRKQSSHNSLHFQLAHIFCPVMGETRHDHIHIVPYVFPKVVAMYYSYGPPPVILQ